ncbi:MAG: hypothetical protein K6B52_09445 [Clostridiales bacterium]|nr:hypothetical protein [Clostridiales bacterium]
MIDNFSPDKLTVFFEESEGKFASEILCGELLLRTGKSPEIISGKENAVFSFGYDPSCQKDEFKIDQKNDKIVFIASNRRGFIYAVGYFLRKIVKTEGGFGLAENINGFYSPSKKIRGHQLGYRDTPNTYDAWDLNQYERYYLELMFFGSNTVEHIPYEDGVSNRNPLMKYDEEDFLVEASLLAEKYNLDFSLWFPNNNTETSEQAVERRKKLFKRLPRIDIVFPPGGDPGDYPAGEFIDRCRKFSSVLKESHLNAEVWPSAQAPHGIPDWGERFIESMSECPDEIGGVIQGPNKAFEIDELRRRLPGRYPLRFYPDVSHNVRCDYPVHFDRCDWHFSLNAALSRECTNPRPLEYAKLHKMISPYVIGSVTYSEGITDDINKAVWADRDFDPSRTVGETLSDYCRLFFFGADTEKIVALINMLEFNWFGDPVDNSLIDITFEGFCSMLSAYPFLGDNWRFLQLYFRALCDYLVRYRRKFELKLIENAYSLANSGDIAGCVSILSSSYDEEYIDLRSEMNSVADRLFKLIGLQLDCSHYFAKSWERGAVLETFDLPVTDRQWLLGRINIDKGIEYNISLFERNKVDSDEMYYSVAYDGLDGTGCVQKGEVYLNFQGDRKNVNNGSLHTGMFNVYDNYSFFCKAAGLTAGCDYKLIVTFLDRKNPDSDSLTIKANGVTIYKGAMFGETDEDFNTKYLCDGFTSAVYKIPHSCIENGCVDLVFSEDTMGVMFCEFRLIKDK